MKPRLVRPARFRNPPARQVDVSGDGVTRRGAGLLTALCATLLLSACGTVSWVKTRFVEPLVGTPPAQSGSSVSQRATPAPTPKAAGTYSAEASAPRVPAGPPVSLRAPLPPTSRPIAESAPQETAPLAPPPVEVAAAPATAAPPPSTPMPVTQPAVSAPAPVAPPAARAMPEPRPAAAPVAPPAARPVTKSAAAPQPAPRVAMAKAPAAAGELPAGQWAVQVGVFHVANSADAVRARVASQLEQSAGLAASDRATRVVKRENKYFVVVGDEADRASAEALAEHVRATLKQDVVLFRR